MKDNIIVTSSGFLDSAQRSIEIDTLYKNICNNKKVLIIDNAASNPQISSNYFQRTCVQKNFINFGANIVDILTINKDNTKEILNYDIIYMLGGIVTELVQLINETDFKEQILKFLKNGIYIGESAGSIILSDDVEYIYDLKKGMHKEFDNKLQSYKGLGLINLYIFPHYNSVSDDIKERIANYKKVKVTSIQDGQYILCSF